MRPLRRLNAFDWRRRTATRPDRPEATSISSRSPGRSDLSRLCDDPICPFFKERFAAVTLDGDDEADARRLRRFDTRDSGLDTATRSGLRSSRAQAASVVSGAGLLSSPSRSIARPSIRASTSVRRSARSRIAAVLVLGETTAHRSPASRATPGSAVNRGERSPDHVRGGPRASVVSNWRGRARCRGRDGRLEGLRAGRCRDFRDRREGPRVSGRSWMCSQ